jgi:cytidylate kinase
MDRQIVPHEKYVSQLARIVLAAARGAHCVFVGRGAQFMLPRDRGLAVRLVAPERFRVERIMRLEGRSAADARQRVEQLDRGRAEFVERFFHHAVADPHLYDLVINTERWGMEGAAEQIAAAARG